MKKELIRLLGDVMQLAFVPADVEATIAYWTEAMGVGPFFKVAHAQRTLDSHTYRGQPCEADFTLMIAYWGHFQIEIIEQHNSAPSIYQDWREANGEGLHHICVQVNDLDAAIASCVEAGAELLQCGQAGASAYAYVDTKGGPGTILELFSPSPEVRAHQEYMKAAARQWDGTNPIRDF